MFKGDHDGKIYIREISSAANWFFFFFFLVKEIGLSEGFYLF